MDKMMIPALRRVMAEFIAADSRSIELQRPKLEKTPTGGFKKAAWEILPAQNFRLVPYKRRLTDLVKNMANGEIPHIAYVMVCPWDSDIKRLDEFDMDGAYYRVQGLEPHTAVQEYTDRKVAQVVVLDKEGVEWITP